MSYNAYGNHSDIFVTITELDKIIDVDEEFNFSLNGHSHVEKLGVHLQNGDFYEVTVKSKSGNIHSGIEIKGSDGTTEEHRFKNYGKIFLKNNKYAYIRLTNLLSYLKSQEREDYTIRISRITSISESLLKKQILILEITLVLLSLLLIAAIFVILNHHFRKAKAKKKNIYKLLTITAKSYPWTLKRLHDSSTYLNFGYNEEINLESTRVKSLPETYEISFSRSQSV